MEAKTEEIHPAPDTNEEIIRKYIPRIEKLTSIAHRLKRSINVLHARFDKSHTRTYILERKNNRKDDEFITSYNPSIATSDEHARYRMLLASGRYILGSTITSEFAFYKKPPLVLEITGRIIRIYGYTDLNLISLIPYVQSKTGVKSIIKMPIRGDSHILEQNGLYIEDGIIRRCKWKSNMVYIKEIETCRLSIGHIDVTFNTSQL